MQNYDIYMVSEYFGLCYHFDCSTFAKAKENSKTAGWHPRDSQNSSAGVICQMKSFLLSAVWLFSIANKHLLLAVHYFAPRL
jgi:hypothetical protein